ncbi:hypothetical protein [Devosia sp. Leaf64]|uniref:hypothetical protein n=1 Tax=Devosia sp. Leaf64 TaxID=1736229 RepID=UPI0007163E11|nr:hypothetical protein [Devosia sp. Leaf64]KQN74805.1 hypothetical protein ASE94_00215 [Devosia sp. Leaf64]
MIDALAAFDADIALNIAVLTDTRNGRRKHRGVLSGIEKAQTPVKPIKALAATDIRSRMCFFLNR